MRLKGKVAIVTGSGAGIGKGIAEVFAAEGARVVGASRRAANGRPVIDAILASGGDGIFVACDVSSEEDVRALFQTTLARYGRVDVLVNNAGVDFVKPFDAISAADWDRVVNTDLRGTFLCSRLAIEPMLRQGGGAIVNIASVHTLQCVAAAAPYDAAKWGVVGLTKSMAVEFAARNIRVNVLSPGLIDTQIWQDLQKAAPDAEACLAYWKSNIPMGRVGSPWEIAQAAVFLASDDASYITGANLVVDGGMTSQLVSLPPYQPRPIEGRGRT